MDTLQTPISTPSTIISSTFSQTNRSSPIIDNPTNSSTNHADGVWVAPPEQLNKTNLTNPSFPHGTNQRVTNPSFPPSVRTLSINNFAINALSCFLVESIDFGGPYT